MAMNRSEQRRRKKFQDLFDPHSYAFTRLPLSGARNVTLHRTGVAPVEVHVIGRWGSYTGNPLTQIPQSEMLPTTAGSDPALQWAATQPPQAVCPNASDFWLLVSAGSSTS
jgi:hypothetical protein